MSQTQLIRQTVTVKGVFPKATSKYKKASILVPANGKDEYLGLNEEVNENLFQVGKTYEIGVSVAKSGKRYVSEFIGEVGTTPAKEAAHSPTATVHTDAGLDRDTRITYMNVANVAATLIAGNIKEFDNAFDTIVKKYKELGVL